MPAAYLQHAHHWLILHGRYTCVARNPKCGECPIADLCRWPDKTAPTKGKPSAGAKAAPAEQKQRATRRGQGGDEAARRSPGQGAGSLTMFSPSRDEARRFLMGAWEKFRAQAPLTPLESIAARLVAMHPEYHALLEAGDEHLDRDWRPEHGETNPFLHLSLHLAVAEQLSIDQPRGLVAHFERLKAARGDEHAALHAVLDCLGETVWHAQRHGTPPDATVYLGCLERQR